MVSYKIMNNYYRNHIHSHLRWLTHSILSAKNTLAPGICKAHTLALLSLWLLGLKQCPSVTHISSLHSSLSQVCMSCHSFSAPFAPVDRSPSHWWKGCFLSKVTLGSHVLILKIGKKNVEGYIKDIVCWNLHKQLCESLFYNKVEKKICL